MKATSPLFLVVMFGMIIVTFFTPDARLFREPTLARIIFYHVPCAFVATGFLFGMAWFAIRHLYPAIKSRKERPFEKSFGFWDLRLQAATEMGTLYAALTLFTGMIFSYYQWGDWWHWDARQTSFLIVTLMFGGAIALRTAFTDDQKKASASSVYALAMQIPAVFLTFVYPNIPAVKQQSLHPTGVVVENKMDLWYVIPFYGMLIMFIIIAVTIYKLKVRAGMVGLALEAKDGMDTIGSRNTAPAGHVRPVALHDER